ncbi:MAG: C10 family peptidase [Muribaculaceae bacterium]|nr:C10 family peptidase [Muribaculaceae bacterium]MDE7155394.1 C10 family peptidase [Muribaculaceae bacterium]MDE7369431.1 C10 family peptidase [Muribaculaceae bacterium]
MYKTNLLVLAFLSIFICSCSQDDILVPTVAENVTESVNLKSIKRYIQKRYPVKSRSNTQLIPIIQDGDTVAYLANYAEGWELFSNNTDLPMVLMKSNTGSFYPNTSLSKSPFEKFYSNLIANLSSISHNDVPDQTWTLYNEGRPRPGEDGGPGDNDGDDDKTPGWGWVGDALERTTNVYAPKGGRLKTKWIQQGNYNQFTPYYDGHDGWHTPLGCCAVALGQILYHNHKYFGIPQYTVTTALYDHDSNSYIFSGSDSNVWDLMDSGEDEMFCRNAELMKQTAIFLGYVAKEIYSIFGNVTGAMSIKVLDFMSRQLKREYNIVPFSWDNIYPSLNYGSAVYLSLNGENIDHACVIDYAEEQQEVWYEIYAYRKHNDESVDDSDNDFNGEMAPPIDYYRDKYGEISVEHTFSMTDRWIKINWGWIGDQDDILIAVNEKVWNAGGDKFHQQKIFIADI